MLDAPGHKNFVPHMIGGASQADIGVLVIAARKGEFETGFEKGGQTREHIQLAKTAGVKQLLVVINKMDDKTVEWSIDRCDLQCKCTAQHLLKKWTGCSQLRPYLPRARKTHRLTPRPLGRYNYCKEMLTPFLKASGFRPKKVRRTRTYPPPLPRVRPYDVQRCVQRWSTVCLSVVAVWRRT